MTTAATASYPTLKVGSKERPIYYASVPIDDLYPHVTVLRRAENPAEGFQRELDLKRVKAIAEHIDAGKTIPNNVILSAQPEAEFAYDRATKSLKFHRVAGAFFSLDGQHRLYGYQAATRRERVVVSIHVGLSRAEETAMFLEIHQNQKGLPSSLVLDVAAQAGVESKREAALRSLYDRLSTDKLSPLRGRTSPTGAARDKLSRTTFYRAAGPALRVAERYQIDDESAYKLTRTYLAALADGAKDKGLILRAAALGAFFEVFDDVVAAAVDRHGDAKPESLARVVAPIATIDYSDIAGMNGKVNKETIARAMRDALRRRVKLTGAMVEAG